MSTEAELREALRSLEELAPDVDAVLPDVRRGHPLRRRTLLLAGAAATATAVAAPIAIRVLGGSRNGEPESGRRHPWVFTVSFDETGYNPYYLVSDETVQLFTLQAGDGSFADIAVYDRGTFNPDATDLTRPSPTPPPPPMSPFNEPVTINGRHGFYRDKVDIPDAQLFPGVVWEYAPGSWAAVSAPDRDRGRTLALASTLRFGQRVPIRIPVRIPVDLPGFQPQFRSWNRFRPFGQTILELAGPAGRLRLETMDRLRDDTPSGVVEVGGRSAVRWFEWFRLDVDGDLPQDQLRHIVESAVQCPDPLDRRTWFDASTAVPL